MTVSIHASVMEATCPRRPSESLGNVSIHASVMEATRRGVAGEIGRVVSIHASVMEATRRRIRYDRITPFRSTPP